MDFRRKPDYADTAYREAVGRLRILLAESYAPIKRPVRELDSAGEETDNQSMISAGSRNSRPGRSYYHYNPITLRRYHYYPPPRTNYNVLSTETEKPLPDPPKTETTSANPELMSFIERQEEYIEQLEKESRFCRAELSSLLSKVKDVISENENLHEKQKSKLIKSVFDHLETETETETETDTKNIPKSPLKSKKRIHIEGPSIVFESRISELEAQLTQARIDLKKALDESESYKKKLNDGTILETAGYESYKKQIENFQREKETLQQTVNKLQNALSLLRDKENDTCDKVKRSLDVAEQAQYEKNAAEAEIRRLKDELERQHLKLRDAISEQGRRIADERSAVERRYTQQIEQLTTELGVQWETTNKLQLELDKQRRENGDLRREVAQKQALIDELKKDMQSKIITLQTDIGVSGAEKSALEQQIATLQMANERTERQSKQEIGRLQAEIQSLRQRLDRADADLIHSRRENIRLSEQVASLEKEIALNTALSEERSKTPRSGEIVALPPPTQKKEDREKEMTSMIQDMESKHDEESAPSDNQRDEPQSVRNQKQENLIRKNSNLPLKSPSRQDSEDSFQNATLPPHQQPQQAPKNHGQRLTLSDDKSGTTYPKEQDSENQIMSHKGKTVQPSQPKQQQQPNQQQQQNQQQQNQQQMQQQQQIQQMQQQQLQDEQQLPSSQDEQFLQQQYEPITEYGDNQEPYNLNQEHYDPNQEYDPSQQYDPNQQYDLNQGYDPSQEYNPNQHFDNYEGNNPYTVDPNESNQQYAIDPSNENYAIDTNNPNQQYLVDPNDSQQYAVDPANSTEQYAFDSNVIDPNIEPNTK